MPGYLGEEAGSTKYHFRQELAEAVGQPLEAMDTVASLMVTAALVASLGAGLRVDRGGSVAGGAQLE